MMPFPAMLPPKGMGFEDMLVYAASEMPPEELARYVQVLEDELKRSGLLAMARAVRRLRQAWPQGAGDGPACLPPAADGFKSLPEPSIAS
jgi:hypothetical protein